MIKHHPRPRHYEQQRDQQQQKDRGWYCKEHDTKYLCDICGYDKNVHNKQKEMKYYFVSG
jgi:hypothetical protein